MLDDVSLDQLRTFIAAADEGSVDPEPKKGDPASWPGRGSEEPGWNSFYTVLRIGRLRRDTWSVSHLTDALARAATRGADSWV